MQKTTAQIVSYLLSPFLLVIVGGTFFSYKATESIPETIFWTGVTAIFTAIIAGYIIFGVKKGFFSDLDISKQKERYLFYPFLLTVLIAYTVTVLVLGGPEILVAAGLFLIPTVLLFELINKRIKGSIHTASVSAAAVGFAFYYQEDFLILLLLIPLMIWSRVITKKHSLNETLVGCVYGSVFAIIGVYVVQFFR